MNLDLTGVECFVTVAEHRHFGHAAQALGVSVSTVTKRLHKLESSLGVPLVVRGPAGFSDLTPAGRRLIQVAPELLRSARVASEIAVGEPGPTLRVAVPAGVGVVAPLLPSALGTLELALRHLYPAVSVVAVPTPFDRMVDDVVRGHVDVLLTFGRSSHPDIESVRLSPLHRVGIVAAGHPMARRRSVPAAEFAALPMIYSPDLPDWYMHPFVLADVRPLSGARLVPLRASTTAHVAERLLLGREVTVVPLALTANLPDEIVRVVLRDLPGAWYHAHHRRDDTRPELRAADELMSDFTDSISRAAAD